jgi:hypothetical protein
MTELLCCSIHDHDHDPPIRHCYVGEQFKLLLRVALPPVYPVIEQLSSTLSPSTLRLGNFFQLRWLIE